MRDYSNVDSYLNELIADIYPQPEDVGHTNMAQATINRWMSNLPDCKSVLDVGCGTGFCQPMFEKWGVSYEGVCLGSDFLEAQKLGRNVQRMDFNFLDYDEQSFDLIFSRHSLEHSFSPLISLMEWHRVSKSWLGVIVPAPEHYGYGGRNHNYVLNREQLDNLLERAGWHPIWENMTYIEDGIPQEYCIFCEKKRRMIYR